MGVWLMDRCDFTDMLVDQCHHCRTPTDGPSWRAEFFGGCAVCMLPVEVGQMIRWADGDGSVQHARH